MKDNDSIMIFGVKIEKGRKSPMKMVQNKEKSNAEKKKSVEDTKTKNKNNLYDFVEKTVLGKEQPEDIKASKPGATIDNMDNSPGIGASARYKHVHESTSKPPKEDVRTSIQQNDIVQSPSQAKRQKVLKYTVSLNFLLLLCIVKKTNYV
uniref:Uncharacterized protein n=1 Tax=Solanum lycopersicum TaxID=4081 RepID=K4CCA2_SOLLC